MSGRAASVVITVRQQAILRALSVATTVATTVAYRLRQRARMILLAFEKQLNRDIAAAVSLGRDQVAMWRRRWRRRWQNEFEKLTVIEGSDDRSALRRAIEWLLSDEQRSGCPPTFTAEQLTLIFAIACEAVEDSGRPVARWTQLEIIDEAVKRGIVKSMSTSHLSTLLAEAQLQPHKSRYWLNTKEKDPEVFEQQMQTVCDCYQQAPELLTQCDTHTVCMDQMTSIQALERIAPKKRGDRASKNGSNLNTGVMARCV